MQWCVSDYLQAAAAPYGETVKCPYLHCSLTHDALWWNSITSFVNRREEKWAGEQYNFRLATILFFLRNIASLSPSGQEDWTLAKKYIYIFIYKL